MRNKVQTPGDKFFNEMCSKIHSIMLKPSRVSTRASVNTSMVPRLTDVQSERGVYDSGRAVKPASDSPQSARHAKVSASQPNIGDATSIQVRLSGKKGVVRGESQTGRRDLCARQVMTCYNYKSVTEMIISPSIAHNLKRLETVNPLNMARLVELQMRGLLTSMSTERSDNFMPCVSRLMYEPRVGDVIVDTRGSSSDPCGRRYTVTVNGQLPIGTLKPYHRVLRRGKVLDPCVPQSVQVLSLRDKIERPMQPGDIGMRLRNPCVF